ncbi:MAG: NAD(+) diphosphatase [Victivallaceae bacterium]|nr:NAD(+) diphosphatase [Victivallaceae bacterium]
MFIPNAVQGNFVAAKNCDPEARIVALNGADAVVGEGMTLPGLRDLHLPPETPMLRVGVLDEKPCFVCRIPDGFDGFSRIGGRAVLAGAAESVREALCRGREMLFWRENRRFCGKCGLPLVPSTGDLAMICPDCGAHFYPQIAPAVIVAITRKNGEELLLAHNRRFEDGVFSLIAGFVEAGESAEEAIHREIKEEVGIDVDAISYLGSQSWPFPNSLMLAFRARCAGGAARADGTELSECRGCRRDTLPGIPKKGSIARAVIDRFAAGEFAPRSGRDAR